LTNTRYLLGAMVTALPNGNVDTLSFLNGALDPKQKRFRIAKRFDIVVKSDITQTSRLEAEDLTAQTNADGDLAVFDFTGALPRVKLYSNWQVNTNDQEVLKTLADLNFDPAQTVLVDTPKNDLPAVSTNKNSGTVEFKSYAPEYIVFAADAVAPSVLLLNDKYDPNWHVTVDGKPAALLRCNFIMRGVYLQRGQHTVIFDFRLPNKPLYVTLAAMGIGFCLLIWLMVALKRESSLKR